MENKKKIKFNGMDLFIIVIVITVIAAAVYLFVGKNGGKGSGGSSNVVVRTTVELTAKDENYAESIKVGDKVMIGEKEKMTTTVEKVDVKPARTIGYDILDGRVLYSTVPHEYDVQVTVVADGTETDRTIETDGIPVRVGQNVAMFGKGWSSTGYIINIDTDTKQQ